MMPRERLTPKEIQVAILVWQGLTNREIGKIIGTTEQVIKNHLRSTFDKLGVWSRLELAMYVASHGGRNWPPSESSEIPNNEPFENKNAIGLIAGATPGPELSNR